MYIVSQPVNFSITRAKNASPASIASVRITRPNGAILNASISATGHVNNTNPTSTTTGILVFSDTPVSAGLHKFEVLDTGNDLLMYSFSINVIAPSNTFATQITV